MKISILNVFPQLFLLTSKDEDETGFSKVENSFQTIALTIMV